MKALTKSCDICHDAIGLYQPWYSIKVRGWLTIAKVNKNPMCLCPSCFHAYQDFLIEREVITNHHKNYEDVKNA